MGPPLSYVVPEAIRSPDREERRQGMVKAFVLYEGEAPDPDRYAQHNRDFSEKVPGAIFRHGAIFGAAFGEPKYKYYAEFEFPDMDAFTAATRSEEFAAAGKDASDMGIPFQVYFVEL
jgi:hypothetical protein